MRLALIVLVLALGACRVNPTQDVPVEPTVVEPTVVAPMKRAEPQKSVTLQRAKPGPCPGGS